MRARPGPRAARRVGPVPDPAHPSGGRRGGAPVATVTLRRLTAAPARPGRRCRSSRSLVFGAVVGVDARRPPAARSASTSSPTTRRPTGCSTASRCTTCRPADRRVRRSSTTRRRSSSLILPFALLSATTAVWPWIGAARSRRSVGGVALHAGVARRVRWWIVLLAGLSGRSSTRSSSARSGRSCSCCSRSAGAGSTDPVRLGRRAALGDAIKIQPGLALRLGAAHRPLARPSWSAASSLVVVAASRRSSPGVGGLVRLPARCCGRSATRSRPPHNFTPGAIAYQLGRSSATSRRSSSWPARSSPSSRSSSRPRGRRPRGLVPRRGRRQPAPLAGPLGPLRDAAAAAGRVPAGRGRWWALLIPLATAVAARRRHARPLVYPLAFWVTLVALVVVGPARRARRETPRCRRRRPRRPRDASIGRRSSASARRRRRRSSTGCANRGFDAGRGDFFYLADAFLHGRTWLDVRLGPYDVILVGGRFYVPFAPFPAIALMPLVALIGPVTADQFESGINAVLAGGRRRACAGGCSAGSACGACATGSGSSLLFGFSTQILWVTTRGGVWHTGQLIATILTFACLIELWGRRRAWLIGLLAGAAFLTRAPLAFAIPFYALLLVRPHRVAAASRSAAYIGAARTMPWRAWLWLALGVLPSIVVLLRVQPGPLRVAARVRLRARDAAGVPRGAARAGPVLARATSR